VNPDDEVGTETIHSSENLDVFYRSERPVRGRAGGTNSCCHGASPDQPPQMFRQPEIPALGPTWLNPVPSCPPKNFTPASRALSGCGARIEAAGCISLLAPSTRAMEKRGPTRGRGRECCRFRFGVPTPRCPGFLRAGPFSPPAGGGYPGRFDRSALQTRPRREYSPGPPPAPVAAASPLFLEPGRRRPHFPLLPEPLHVERPRLPGGRSGPLDV